MTSSTFPRARHAAAAFARGVHHLALNTDDMKMTIDFYTRILGMPLVHALRVPPGLGTGPDNRGNPPFENLRHYFFDAGGDSLVAFFEIPKGAKPKGDRDAIGAMQHVSFTLTEARFEEARTRLERAGVSYLGPIHVGTQTYSIYFFDPNGHRVELACPDPDEEVMVKRLDAVKWEMLEEWSKTKRAPKQGAFLHEREFKS